MLMLTVDFCRLLCRLVSEFGKVKKVKGKVFYGQEPPSGESTTTECGFNYQLPAVMH